MPGRVTVATFDLAARKAAATSCPIPSASNKPELNIDAAAWQVSEAGVPQQLRERSGEKVRILPSGLTERTFVRQPTTAGTPASQMLLPRASELQPFRTTSSFTVLSKSITTRGSTSTRPPDELVKPSVRVSGIAVLVSPSPTSAIGAARTLACPAKTNIRVVL
eukprot:7391618-Prymnesium_polylepis.2